jgi:hypothetical protein
MVEISRKKEVEALSSVNIGDALKTQLEIEQMKTLRSLREPKTRRATTVAKGDFGKAVDTLERELKDRERFESVVNRLSKRNPITEVLDTPFGKGIGEAAGGLITELMRGYMAGKEQQAQEARIKALSGKEEGTPQMPPRPIQTASQPPPQATLSLGEEDKRIIEEQKRGQDEMINKLAVVTNTFTDAMSRFGQVIDKVDSLEKKISEMEVKEIKPEEYHEDIERRAETYDELSKEETIEKEEEVEPEVFTEVDSISVDISTDAKEELEEYYSQNYLMKLKLNELKEFGKEKFNLTDQDYEGKKKKQIAFLIGKRQRELKQLEEN